MSPTRTILSAFFAVWVLSACDNAEQVQDTRDAVRPVKTVVVGGAEGGAIRSFPGRVEAANRADVSFSVGGKVVEIAVNEGDQVKDGQVLARLDATDFRIRVKDRQATFDEASANFERGKALVGKGTISRRDFDRLKADFQNSEAALQLARQELAYTTLEAPFAGSVARRLVENFEEVQAKQPVISLRSVEDLEVKIDVPENIVVQFKRVDPDQRDPNRVPVFASFDAAPGERFPLTFKEVSTQADSQTQTFEVTFTLQPPEKLNVLPGMTTTVTADFSRVFERERAFYLPAGAVIADSELKGRVYVVDESTMTVHARPVQVGSMRGNEIAVTVGIDVGDRVVVAGVPFLVEGMKVTLFPANEQAAPRPGDAGPGT